MVKIVVFKSHIVILVMTGQGGPERGERGADVNLVVGRSFKCNVLCSRYEEAENVVGLLQTKEKERVLTKKKRELNKQLDVIKKKEEKSQADKRRNSKLAMGKGRPSGA